MEKKTSPDAISAKNPFFDSEVLFMSTAMKRRNLFATLGLLKILRKLNCYLIDEEILYFFFPKRIFPYPVGSIYRSSSRVLTQAGLHP